MISELINTIIFIVSFSFIQAYIFFLSLRVDDHKISEEDSAILSSLKGKKFAKMTVDETEKISEEEQNKYENSR